jgi:arginine-tRNA-protein transferase
MTIPLLSGTPPELLVLDQLSACPYLPGEVARMPLRLPVRELTRFELDARLAAGDRRQGAVLYRTECPSCRGCEPIRIPVSRFVNTRSLARVERRGDRTLTREIGPATLSRSRLALYDEHKHGRGLGDQGARIAAQDYREFLVASCCETFEIRYHLGGKLVGVAITDRGERALSAVYCAWDPACSALSLGTYSILKQLELCRNWGLEYLYLGLYIANCRAMRYKARYLPHERLIDGAWVAFSRER